MAAIRLAAKLVAEDRPATREEQETLALYIGWGSIKNVFAKDPNRSGSARYRRISRRCSRTRNTGRPPRAWRTRTTPTWRPPGRCGLAPNGWASTAGESIGRTLDVERVMRAAGAVEGVMGLGERVAFDPAKAVKR